MGSLNVISEASFAPVRQPPLGASLDKVRPLVADVNTIHVLICLNLDCW